MAAIMTGRGGGKNNSDLEDRGVVSHIGCYFRVLKGEITQTRGETRNLSRHIQLTLWYGVRTRWKVSRSRDEDGGSRRDRASIWKKPFLENFSSDSGHLLTET